MKNIIAATVAAMVLISVYAYGQANQRPPVKNCCCEHTQQIAEDLRWIREKLSKPYVPPPDVDFSDIGDVGVPEFKVPKIKAPKYNFPKR